MKKICLVIPYFGQFKNYFSLFLLSCKNNPTVDWLIYSDTTQVYNWPPNVIFKRCSFNEFREKIQKLFNFQIELEKPYKLCDYKPCYGEALETDLNGYDFWGYCDCDLIFGNIRKFVTEDILDTYDRIFSRGHLSIFRNNKEVNEYYRKQTVFPIKAVFTNPNSFAFDEWRGTSLVWEVENKKMYDALVMDDIISTLDGFHPTKELRGKYSPYHKNEDKSYAYRKMKKIYYHYSPEGLNRVWIEKGEIKKEDILYVHFQKRKMSLVMPMPTERIDEFIILNDSFLYRGELCIDEHLKEVVDETINNYFERMKFFLYSVLK